MITEQQVLDALREVVDPDVGINVVDLGLIESVAVAPGEVRVGLIMTTPACPQTGYIQDEATRMLLMAAEPGTEIGVDVLDAPFWQPDRMSGSAKAILGWPG